MVKNPPPTATPPEAVISIIGAGMTLVGDTDTDGSLRVEGTIRGSVRAGKSVVVGKDGLVDGSVFTQDAVIAGRVSGGIHAESRLELQATSEVAGEIVAPRMQVEEGAKVQGQVAVGESAVKAVSKAASKAAKTQEVGGGGKVEPQTKQEIGGGRKAESQTKQEVGGGRKAERQTESKQPRDGAKADPQTEPVPGGGAKADPQTEREESKERLRQPSRD
jgi:cytoskeletal protein CcmA (bactofilin family)